MSRIRHIALLTDDPEKMRRFYVNVLGLKELNKSKVHLSDGEIFMNIVKRTPEHNKPVGFYHLGFHIDNVELFRQRLRKEGFPDQLVARPEGVHAEYRLLDPDNILLDVAETCWKV